MSRARRVLERVEQVYAYDDQQIRVSVNPSSKRQLEQELRLSDDFWWGTPSRMGGGGGEIGVIRWLGDLSNGDVYLWDAGLEIHQDMAEHLGIEFYIQGMADRHGITGSRYSPGMRSYLTDKQRELESEIEKRIARALA